MFPFLDRIIAISPSPTQYAEALAVCLQPLPDNLYEALTTQVEASPDLFRIPGNETGPTGFMERWIRTLRERAQAGRGAMWFRYAARAAPGTAGGARRRRGAPGSRWTITHQVGRARRRAGRVPVARPGPGGEDSLVSSQDIFLADTFTHATIPWLPSEQVARPPGAAWVMGASRWAAVSRSSRSALV